MRNKVILLGIAVVCLLGVMGCRKVVEPTEIKIQDPVRHYKPVLQGQTLEIVYQVTNTGKNPLVILDIQASCGCIVIERRTHVIVPPERKEYVRLKYNSNKNIGLVEHTIRLYGNIEPSGVAEMKFDVNVVPAADYTRDYEELFREQNVKNGFVNRFVDGLESERGYSVDEVVGK